MIDEDRARRIYFDTTIFLDAFEGLSAHAEPLRTIFHAAKARPKQAVTSELTLAELFGKESEFGWVRQKRFYLDLIVFSKAFDLRPVSRWILMETGDFRKAATKLHRKIKLADAIHMVSAIEARCQYIFTSDKRFIAPDSMTTVAPDEPGCMLVKQALGV